MMHDRYRVNIVVMQKRTRRNDCRLHNPFLVPGVYYNFRNGY